MTGLMALNRHSFCFKCMKIAAGLNLLFHESLKESSSIPVNSDSTKTISCQFSWQLKLSTWYKVSIQLQNLQKIYMMWKWKMKNH